ncbi:hypothetical protein TrLO_g5172 [Triparma laevis f. longispina]|uniref:Clathrin/coatomer adaptor adaptin-like N-terminal domain-containing protein n=1 Tax=Triparma laevis f. longispina TaxID=1714387 RepID=A0A9W7FG02_9STRA|nr:hypothetical protein TrLO_g5172 [Triparma laevis f. longispina]
MSSTPSPLPNPLASLASTIQSTLNSSSPGGMTGGATMSTMSWNGEAHYFEESITPTTVRTMLSSTHVEEKIKGSKWLLAMMSKGRDVHTFFPYCVKNVSSPSVLLKKLTYIYLIHYSSHPENRSTSLLAINSFQKDLMATNQLIRALALRVLCSLKVHDILQIQLLALKKCASDTSPYVRKCAANAVPKLRHFSNDENFVGTLLGITIKLLNTDQSTMVLGSAVTAFIELSQDYELLHGSFRKLCELLADMDEWSQVSVLGVLAGYARRFFKSPGKGRAEVIDDEKRRGRVSDMNFVPPTPTANPNTTSSQNPSPITLPPRERKKIKRRVIRKAFYSDESDESSEESVYVSSDDDHLQPQNPTNTTTGTKATTSNYETMDSDEHLCPDHRLLLRSSLPLLRSRNSGVVLAVCSLHYYCGVSSIPSRQAIGKALVRIHRDRREISYVVLQAIRFLVVPAPSAFTPFLNEFFVKADDPGFARLAKLDILTALALNHQSVDAVLRELRTYIRHDDKIFVKASIRAVGRVAGQFCRSVFNGENVAINCLSGLGVLVVASRHGEVVGEAVCECRRILQAVKLGGGGEWFDHGDPENVRTEILRRMLLLLLSHLGDDGEDEDILQNAYSEVELPNSAVASCLWVFGEWATHPSGDFDTVTKNGDGYREEVLRLLAKNFPSFDSEVKLQAIHVASKFLLQGETNKELPEYVLNMGCLDVDHDVRDRARFESGILRSSIGLTSDDASSSSSTNGGDTGLTTASLLNMGEDESSETTPPPAAPTPSPVPKSLSREDAVSIITSLKPPPMTAPVKPEDVNSFRFGTLSALVGQKADGYADLPDWAAEDSPSELRDPVKEDEITSDPFGGVFGTVDNPAPYKDNGVGNTYGDSSSSNSDSDSDSSSSSSSNSSSSSSSSSDSEDDAKPKVQKLIDDESESESSSGDDSDSSDSSDDEGGGDKTGSLLPGLTHDPPPTADLLLAGFEKQAAVSNNTNNNNNLSSDFADMVMAPVPVTIPQQQQQQQKQQNPFPPAAPVQNVSPLPTISKIREFLRPAIAGGLSITHRFLRNLTNTTAASAMGLSVNTQVLELTFKNERDDGGSIRRVRVLYRGSVLKKTVLPIEIPTIKPGESAVARLGLDFGTANAARDVVIKFDVKTDRGSYSADFMVPLEERLSPLTLNSKIFEKECKTLGGFQKTKLGFDVRAGQVGGVWEQCVLCANLGTVDGGSSLDSSGTAKFASTMNSPGGIERMLVSVTVNGNTGLGEIIVHSDNAIACSSLAGGLKAGILEGLVGGGGGGGGGGGATVDL